ncbi:MAG: Rrf2 family transcriptional regulator, nitric oxide-sensitive transcriptional repressor [Rhodobacteraceae bacterium HLUCCA12]|nr:MAG: Rrf2 family transcriptional regulator, nitric oxide-sensitive transcriptional repressor [Rhodobacteraceae bacterium HLUCCA12]
MRLTKFTDYSLRVLMYAAMHEDRLVTIEETAEINAISRAHVKKVVMSLTRQGYLRGQRGRSGGFTLAMHPSQINLGKLIRQTEPDFRLVECLGPDNACALTPVCRLPRMMKRALAAFVAVFDAHTLADAITGKVTL